MHVRALWQVSFSHAVRVPAQPLFRRKQQMDMRLEQGRREEERRAATENHVRIRAVVFTQTTELVIDIPQ